MQRKAFEEMLEELRAEYERLRAELTEEYQELEAERQEFESERRFARFQPDEDAVYSRNPYSENGVSPSDFY